MGWYPQRRTVHRDVDRDVRLGISFYRTRRGEEPRSSQRFFGCFRLCSTTSWCVRLRIPVGPFVYERFDSWPISYAERRRLGCLPGVLSAGGQPEDWPQLASWGTQCSPESCDNSA